MILKSDQFFGGAPLSTCKYTKYVWLKFVIFDFTFKEIDLLFAVVTGSGQSEGCVHMIRNLVKAHADISRVVIVQHAVIKPPVLVSLSKV